MFVKYLNINAILLEYIILLAKYKMKGKFTLETVFLKIKIFDKSVYLIASAKPELF